MNDNENEEKEPYGGYLAVYDDAQRLHARRVVESAEVRRQAEVFETQGKALHQIKVLARVGFMLIPEATEEAFEHCWRKAFHIEPLASGQTLQQAAGRRAARDE